MIRTNAPGDADDAFSKRRVAQGVVVWVVLVWAVLVVPPDPGNASLTVVVVVLAWDPSSEPTNAPTPAATNTNTTARATAFQVIHSTLPYDADRCCPSRLRRLADGAYAPSGAGRRGPRGHSFDPNGAPLWSRLDLGSWRVTRRRFDRPCPVGGLFGSTSATVTP